LSSDVARISVIIPQIPDMTFTIPLIIAPQTFR
jgi:hypothetical protein